MVVIDMGDWKTRVGFANDDVPATTFFSRVGRTATQETEGPCVGDGVEEGVHTVSTPFPKGSPIHWENVELLLRHVFGKRPGNVDSVVMSHPVVWDETALETLNSLLTETLSIPAVTLLPSCVLALFASGRTSGLVVEGGAHDFVITPIIDGTPVLDGIRVLGLGGCDLDQAMHQQISPILADDPEYASKTDAERRNVARDVKEKLGYVALDYDTECASSAADNSTVWLSEGSPDQTRPSIGRPRFAVPELLFSASPSSLPALIAESISACHPSDQPSLWGNCLLSGGSSLFPGLDTRLHSELSELSKHHTPHHTPHHTVNIIAPPERALSPWIGGSILAASLPSLP